MAREVKTDRLSWFSQSVSYNYPFSKHWKSFQNVSEKVILKNTH